jgi:hypothetical protein
LLRRRIGGVFVVVVVEEGLGGSMLIKNSFHPRKQISLFDDNTS